MLPYREWKPPLNPPLSGRFVAVVPLIRGIPPKGGGGFAVVPLRASTSRKGGRGLLLGESHCFPIGNENGPPSGCYPLIPPYQGGKKLSPFGVALLPYREWKPPLNPPLIREVCCRCPPDKGDPPEGGRGFCRCPPSGEYVPKRGRGFVFVRGSPTASLSGRKPPLIPPYQGGKKLSPFGVALLPCREWKRPLIPPYQGGLLPLSP